ncbi:DNA (cytosine-5-)-methyltransferase [Paenarthrobacter sp. TA1.8]|uniref:DNA (cytosine-5-)-methyltransferase n=1 Tax=Paenarthrobacter sp. TA1.8 TaxID=3400219 RepID=UPI003B42A31A
MKSHTPATTHKRLVTLVNLHGTREVARVLGQSSRTVERWISEATPTPALLNPALDSIYGAWPTDIATPTDSYTFADLFAGIGGIRLGLERAGAECVFTSEWDKFAVKTYMANHESRHQVLGDINSIDASSIPDHDILAAGFPCQPFSLAGVSKKNSLGRDHGFLDKTQGTLFFNVADLIEKKRPKAFLLENVKNLLSHDGGRTFRVIKEVLEEDLGYSIYHKVVDAKGFVPQHRERIYIVGFQQPVQWDWSQITPSKPVTHIGQVLHDRRTISEAELPYLDESTGEVSARYILSDKLWSYLKAYAAKHRLAGNGFGYGLVEHEHTTRTLSARYHKDGSEILISRGGLNPRRLTPRECARLMGFPDSFKIPVSDTQAYRQFGNSVVVPVVHAIATQIVNHLEKNQARDAWAEAS